MNDPQPLEVKGMVVEDPSTTLPVGSQLRFETRLVNMTPPGDRAVLGDWRKSFGVLLTLSFSDSSQSFVEGSAVLVGPGIALSAWHVLEPRIDALLAGVVAANCFGATEEGLQIWRLASVTRVGVTDLCIIGLRLASALDDGGVLSRCAITTRMPSIGERLTVYGFRAESDQFDRGRPMVGAMWLCAGVVSAVYPEARDSYLMPWPVVEIQCPSWGGMSGGPVFDSDGALVGLLCSSLHQGDEDPTPSFVSMVWPALHQKFDDLGWPNGVLRPPLSLCEIDPLLCSIDRREVFRVYSDLDTRQPRLIYEAWEHPRDSPHAPGEDE